MGKQRPTPPGKLRTREHVLAELSVNHLERQVLLAGFSVLRVHPDYGYDLMMATYNERGEPEPGSVYFQVKATDQLPLLKDGATISWCVSRRDLKLWLQELYPVVLVVYDGAQDKAYWLSVQDYFANRPTRELFASGDWVNVHIPWRQSPHSPVRPEDGATEAPHQPAASAKGRISWLNHESLLPGCGGSCWTTASPKRSCPGRTSDSVMRIPGRRSSCRSTGPTS